MNPECYQSGGFFSVERKRVWGRSWVAIGNADDLRHPGDTIIANVGGQPIFVSRDKKGRLNGFKNVCRHRGSKLVLKNGRYPVISCPYHRWGYSLTGKLLATPLWNTVEGGQKVDMKTGDKMEKKNKRKRTGKKKYKKGERLLELQHQVAHDIALIEEAERMAIAPNEEEPQYLQDGEETCGQISSIRQAFDTEHLKGFNKDDFKLFGVRAEEWGPLVFVNLDDDDVDNRITKKSLKDISAKQLAKQHAEEQRLLLNLPPTTTTTSKQPLKREQSHVAYTPSLLECLGGVVTELDSYPLQELVEVRSGVEKPKANWKLLQENFMEYYHLPSVHPNLCQVSGVDEHKRRQGKGHYVGFVTEPLTAGGTPIDLGVLPDFPNLDAKLKNTAVFHSLFPNVFYFLLPSHMFVVRLEPISPTETREHASLLVHPSLLDDGTATDSATGDTLTPKEIEQRLDAMWDFYMETNDEDIVACQSVQEGIQIESYKGGRMSFRFEETIHRFQNMVADHMVGEPRIPAGDDVVIGGYHSWEAQAKAEASGSKLDV